jgi:hypothetical protein
MNEYIISLLYKSLIRPHLEYGAVIWNTKWQEEIDRIEKVQNRVTKISSLNGYNHDERNVKLKLPSLENLLKILYVLLSIIVYTLTKFVYMIIIISH